MNLASHAPRINDPRLHADFWRNVQPIESGCWIYTGRLNKDGYGVVKIHGKLRLAHRAVYSILVAPPPPDLTCDHLCRIKCCVNPEHIEIVTLAENLRRGHIARRKSTCPQGHYRPFGRRCRQCLREASRKKNAKLRSTQEGLAKSREWNRKSDRRRYALEKAARAVARAEAASVSHNGQAGTKKLNSPAEETSLGTSTLVAGRDESGRAGRPACPGALTGN